MIRSPSVFRLPPSSDPSNPGAHGAGDGFSAHRISRIVDKRGYSGYVEVPSVKIPSEIDLTNMDAHIHCIETEAYGALLKAFSAQSDAISWDKLSLMTELRKELRVSDVEHKELLMKIDLDDTIRTIRQWRRGNTCERQSLAYTMKTPGSVSMLTDHSHSIHKKLETPHVLAPSSKYLPHGRPPAPTLVGPYNDDKWSGDDTVIISTQGNAGQVAKSVARNRLLPAVVKGRESLQIQIKKNISSLGVNNFEKGSDTIHIRQTDMVIREVERIYRAQNPDPSLVEQAKQLLRDHERSLVEAIEKLADVSDGDNTPDHQYYGMQLQNDGHRTHPFMDGQVDKMRGY